jgi:hypothetical protein
VEPILSLGSLIFSSNGTERAAWRILSSLLTGSLLFCGIFDSHYGAHADNQTARNDRRLTKRPHSSTSALYNAPEFFGAQAFVPYPTAEARDRLVACKQNIRSDPQIDLKLSQLDEKLGRESDATAEMRAFVEHAPTRLGARNVGMLFSSGERNSPRRRMRLSVCCRLLRQNAASRFLDG